MGCLLILFIERRQSGVLPSLAKSFVIETGGG
jgi:hypothetical protein